jgi:hypothetical protein
MWVLATVGLKPNPKPETRDPKPETRNPKQVMWSLARPVLATVGLTPKAEL